jgi:hypothetical protein
MDDATSVALRYAETFGAFKFAAGIGYSSWSNPDMLQCSNLGGAANVSLVSAVDCSSIAGSASLMHSPTGLYVSGGAGQLKDNNRDRLTNSLAAGLSTKIKDTDSSWWIQGVWVAKLNSLGATSYGNIANQTIASVGTNDVLNSFTGVATVNIQKAESNTISLGITQDIDAAAMKIYMGYIMSSTDLTLVNRANLQTQKSNSVEDVSVFFTGATIKF